MIKKETPYKRQLFVLLAISAVVRLIFASAIELGNDEVYYRIFGLFPDWSYFDHPPLVAWIIRLTTMGSSLAGEVWVRLSSVIIGTVNTWLIFGITRQITNNDRTGFIAALLYTASIYGSIIVGTFILPDTPLSLFWLATLAIFVRILPNPSCKNADRLMLTAGAMIGLAILSKYSGAYLWGAAGLYILLYSRAWMARWSLWVAILVSGLMTLPIVIWNLQNDFISFTFHSARVTAQTSINWLYLGRELMGGIFYNNPIVVLASWTAAIIWLKGRRDFIGKEYFRLLIIFSVPLIILFLGISITRETLPHWAAPAYFAMMIIGASYLGSLQRGVRWAYIAVTMTALVFVAGLAQINYGLLDLNTESDPRRLGRTDFSLDTYGWRQGGEKFAKIYSRDIAMGIMPISAPVVHYGWDDAAHLDTYFALPLGLQVKTIGDTTSTHYWEWITARRGGLHAGDDMYLIVSSRWFAEPTELFSEDFTEISPADTIRIERRSQHVMSFYVYRMRGLKPQSKIIK